MIWIALPVYAMIAYFVWTNYRTAQTHRELGVSVRPLQVGNAVHIVMAVILTVVLVWLSAKAGGRMWR